MKGDSSSPEETVASSSYFENIGLSYAHIHLSKQGKKIFGRAAEQDKCIRHNKHIVNVFFYIPDSLFFYIPESLFYIYLSCVFYIPESLFIYA